MSIMTGGSECPNARGMYASSAIRFICDTSVFGSGTWTVRRGYRNMNPELTTTPGKPELVAQLPPDDSEACAFFFEWRTHVSVLLLSRLP